MKKNIVNFSASLSREKIRKKEVDALLEVEEKDVLQKAIVVALKEKTIRSL